METQNIDVLSEFYSDISKQLLTAADHYNNPMGEELYMGFIEVARLIESLSDIYKVHEFPQEEILELKKIIKGEFECLLNDLEYQFQAFPDEITRSNIQKGKILVNSFNVYENS
jgi:hypothetical protein